MSVYKYNGGKQITPPKVGVSDVAYAHLHPDNPINDIWAQLNGKAIDAAQASARVMDEVVPLWATNDKPMQNFECARDILAAGPQDEFTERVGRLIKEHPQPGQEELRRALKPFALERNIFHIFWTGAETYDELAPAYASMDADLASGKPPGEIPLAKIPTSASVTGLAQRREQFDALSRNWGEGMAERLSGSFTLPVGDAMYSWVQCLEEDILHERVMQSVFMEIPKTIPSGKPLDEGTRELLNPELERSPRELSAVGLILARGDIMEKWDFFDPEAKSNYSRSIERLNGGVDVTLPQVCEIVRAKYPLASSVYPPLPKQMGDK